MSCLYSSPELLPWIALRLNRLTPESSHADAARAHAHRITMPSESVPMPPAIAFNKRRVPHPPAFHRQRTKSFNLPKQAEAIAQCFCYEGFCCVSLQAQYQAFVHVAVESSTAIALEWTCVLEPFNRRASVSGLYPPQTCGASDPVTDVVGGT